MTQQSAYVWHPLHCRWQCNHSITPNESIYDVTSTSVRTTQPLYQTSHPVYLCHHIVSTDISPTFVWHHTHLWCDIIWIIFNITPKPYVITLLYLCHHSLYIYETTSSMRATYTLYMWHHSHYLCHHTQCADNITPTLFMTSHSPYVWHCLPYTRHQILTFWPQTTILRTSHPLY